MHVFGQARGWCVAALKLGCPILPLARNDRSDGYRLASQLLESIQLASRKEAAPPRCPSDGAQAADVEGPSVVRLINVRWRKTHQHCQ